MDFEKGDYIINIYKLKAHLFDSLAELAVDEHTTEQMLSDRFLTYMEIVNDIKEEVGSEIVNGNV